MVCVDEETCLAEFLFLFHFSILFCFVSLCIIPCLYLTPLAEWLIWLMLRSTNSHVLGSTPVGSNTFLFLWFILVYNFLPSFPALLFSFNLSYLIFHLFSFFPNISSIILLFYFYPFNLIFLWFSFIVFRIFGN